MRNRVKIINDFFDELEFWDSAYFGKPIINETELIIPTRNIRVYEEHPLNNTNEVINLPSARLVFSNVKKSERVIGEYIGEPESGMGFKPSYTIIDGPFLETNEPTTEFYLEGILDEPLSYVTWKIESVSFHLEI